MASSKGSAASLALSRFHVVHKKLLSISNGQATIVDMDRLAGAPKEDELLLSLLERLEAIPFVRKAEYVKHEFLWESRRIDALLRLKTDAGLFEYFTEAKRSFLGTSVTHAVASYARELAQHGIRLLLVAPYLPGPTAERLIEGGVDFVDLEGNTHISLEPHYHWTSIGHRKKTDSEEQRPLTAATLQVWFVLAAHPDSSAWTVREIAASAGVSKSKAAKTLGEFSRHTLPRRDLEDQLLYGYRNVLRPRLVIGRYRPQEKNIDDFLARFQEAAATMGFRYALSGAPAAHRLQKFYRAQDATIFVEPEVRNLTKRLRLLPDRKGPVTLLESFGDLVYWRTVEGARLTHPWLIYAELMNNSDPRAHEAAQELRREFLEE